MFRIGQLGDILVALPAIWAVRNYFSQAQITLLNDSYFDSEFVTPEEILPRNELLDDYIYYKREDSFRKNLWNYLQLLFLLRRSRFDVLVYLAPRTRSRKQILRDLLFFRLAGIPQFVAQRGFWLPRDESRGILPSIEREADHFLDRLAKSGITIAKKYQGYMDLRFREDELKQAEKWLNAQFKERKGCIKIGFGPGSKWESKIWPLGRYLEVGYRLKENFDIFPIIFGGKGDKELGDYLISRWGVGVNMAGEISVRQAGAILHFCDVYVGNDTGIMHLANAVGTPCVVISPAIDWPGRWNPYGNKNIVLRRSVPCAGCHLRVCIKEEMKCLKGISVEEVVEACRKIIKKGKA